MAAITFDTLKFVEKLESAGVNREQAKAEAEALGFSHKLLPDFNFQQLRNVDFLRFAESNTN